MYEGHENILHFPLKCTMKTHAEGVAESMGSVIDSHCQKRRGLYDWRNGKRIHHTLKWTPGASYNLGKKLLKSFLVSCHENGSIGVNRFEKCLSTKITSAFFLIHIRMCLLQVLDNLRISSLNLIVKNIQVLCNFAEDRIV